MGEWIGGYQDGWMDGWRTIEFMDQWRNNGMLERVNRTVGWMCEWVDCWQIDRWIDGERDRKVLQPRLGMGDNALHCPHLKVTSLEELNEVKE